jgi:hypothetical protein
LHPHDEVHSEKGSMLQAYLRRVMHGLFGQNKLAYAGSAQMSGTAYWSRKISITIALVLDERMIAALNRPSLIGSAIANQTGLLLLFL